MDNLRENSVRIKGNLLFLWCNADISRSSFLWWDIAYECIVISFVMFVAPSFATPPMLWFRGPIFQGKKVQIKVYLLCTTDMWIQLSHWGELKSACDALLHWKHSKQQKGTCNHVILCSCHHFVPFVSFQLPVQTEMRSQVHVCVQYSHSVTLMKAFCWQATPRSLLDTLSLLHYCGSCSKQCNNERASVSWAPPLTLTLPHLWACTYPSLPLSSGWFVE